ncbi:MAG: ASKHA domain-containing protein [Spirochaetales bacterium]
MDTPQKITIHTIQDGKGHFGEYGSSAHLLDYLSRHTPFTLQAPCGGKGKCGKCKIRILSGTPSPITEAERSLLQPQELSAGIRLACLTKAESDLSIALEGEKKVEGNKAFRFPHPLPVDGSIRTLVLELVPPSLEDQRSDHSRLLSALETETLEVPTQLLSDLPQILREGNWRVTLLIHKNRVLSLLPGTPSGKTCGVAIDIGTTTVAAYLFDLHTGEHLDAQSELNAQGAFGADVISRIQFALEDPSNLERLQDKILTQIDGLIQEMANRRGILPSQICLACLVGNPTMIHLALGLNPKYIAEAPFIPVTTEPLLVPAHELGLSLSSGGLARVPPAVSAYVGSDILAGVVASGMAEAVLSGSADPTLLIDIGTNGEIVLSVGDRFIACSTAAGPAFEGAQITCGVGGVAGGIDRVMPGDNSGKAKGRQGMPRSTRPVLSYTTILESPPTGLCGAGIVDLLAFLLDAGIVDETGRMLTRDEAMHEGHPFADLLVLYDGEPAFQLVSPEHSGTGMPILLTQQDVREIQLAKAAIAAGIRTLLNTMDLSCSDIRTLYLAGGFGNYLDPRSATRIGLIPPELKRKIHSIGDAAGRGASLALLSEHAFALFQRVRERTSYIELSSSPEFQELYVEEMLFPT